MSEEIWKDIKGFEGLYRVSNLGRVKSLKRPYGLKEKILKPKINSCGYYQVTLCKQSIRKMYLVHRLVWEVFNGTIPEGYEINHLDERPVNNALSNLSLVTHKENNNYGTHNERAAKKRINGKLSKVVLQFTLEDILIKEYPSAHQVERETGYAFSHISACCNGKQKTAYNFKWKYKE